MMSLTTIPRVFLAIALPKYLYTQVQHILEQLASSTTGDEIRWSTSQNIHLTCHFFGTISSQKLDLIRQIIPPCISNFEPFPLSIVDCELFPSAKHPRVLAAIPAASTSLLALINRLNQTLEKNNFVVEKRPFRAHLSLGRVKSHKLLYTIPPHCRDLGMTFEVGELTLYKSISNPDGPIYEPLAVFPMGTQR